MPPSRESNRRRVLCAASLIALAAIFITNPLTHLLYPGPSDALPAIAARGFATSVHMALLVGSVLGITQLLRSKADRTGLIGGTLVVMGWANGIRILTLTQLESLLSLGITGFPADTLRRMFEAAPIVWVSIVPIGLLFPIGMIVLGVALIATRAIPRAIGALLVIGAVLFPVGRIGRLGWAFLSCDLILGASLALIGWQILMREEIWGQEDGARNR